MAYRPRTSIRPLTSPPPGWRSGAREGPTGSDARARLDELSPAPLEAWLSARAPRILLAGALAALLVRLLLVLQVAGGPLPELHRIAFESDAAFFDQWGQRLAAGDWLQRAPLHPLPGWMRDVASTALRLEPGLPVRLGIAAAALDERALQGKLWDHWLGGATWFQEPGYPWLIGLVYLLTGGAAWGVFALQLLLGVAGVVLVQLVARRLFSHTAAAAAGLLAVLSPVPLVFELALLRDAAVATATVALTWLLLRAMAQEGRARWFGLGVAFGAAALLKQSFLLFPALLAVAAVVRGPRASLRPAGLVAAGLAAALAPAILRNLLVGVAPLAMNGSAAAMLPLFHTVDASPLELVAGERYARILLETDGHGLAGLLAAAATHDSSLGFLLLQARKLVFVAHGFEVPGNVDLYVFARGAPLLAALPIRFWLVAALAGVGAAVAWRRSGPLVPGLLASLATLVLAAAYARYRAALFVALLPLAGAGAAQLVEWVRARRLRALGLSLSLALPYVAWASRPPPPDVAARRAVGLQRAAEAFATTGPALGALYALEALEERPGDPTRERLAGALLLVSGDPAAALPHLEAAAAREPSAELHALRAHALAGVGRRDDALAAARAALALDPASPLARQLVDELAPQRSR